MPKKCKKQIQCTIDEGTREIETDKDESEIYRLRQVAGMKNRGTVRANLLADSPIIIDTCEYHVIVSVQLLPIRILLRPYLFVSACLRIRYREEEPPVGSRKTGSCQ